MTHAHRLAWTLLAACFLPTAAALAAAPAEEDPFRQLKQYDDGQARKPLRTVEMLIARATGDAQRKAELADRLAALLADAKVSLAAKRFACGQLALVGSDAHVPLLAGMLAKAETAEPARRVLAAIPGEAAGKALRDALGALRGSALIGAINSLGARCDAEAVDALARQLTRGPGPAAEAAARALGKIGTTQAAAALGKAAGMANVLAGLDALCDGRLRCAERLAEAGKPAEAAAVYRKLYDARSPRRWRIAVLTGLSRTAKDQAAPLVLDALSAKDAALRAVALRLTRDLPDARITAALVKRLAASDPAAQAGLIAALGERGDKSAAAAVGERLSAKDDAVRAAAARAMATLGDASSAAPLARLAGTTGGSVQQAARWALARLRGAGVDGELLALAAKGVTAERVEVIQAVVARRAGGGEAALLKLAADSQEPVRAAAVEGLATIGGQACYAALIDRLVADPTSGLARAIEKALLAVGGRLDGAEARTGPLLAALKTAKPKAKCPLLRLLGAAGGADALRAVRATVKDADPAVVDAAVRALAGWEDLDAAGDLLALARDSGSAVHRTLALRGYLRLARTAAGGPAERIKRLQAVREIATNLPAKRLLLSGLSDVPDAAAMELALAMLDDAAVRREAALAALKIGRALLASDRRAVRAAMAKLQAKAADESVRKQAKALHAESLKPPPRRRGAGGTNVGLRHDKARSEARKNGLAKKPPKGFRLACYLDCGPDTADAAKGGPTLRVLGGQAYSWSGADKAADVRAATIHYTTRELAFEATGLSAKKAYQLGLSWWDFDHDTRAASIWLSAGKPARTVKLLAATKLPSYQAGRKPPDEKTLPIPRAMSAFGSVRVVFRNEGGPNVVVSELWLWASEADLPAVAAMPPQAAPPPGSTPSATKAARAKPAAKARPRATEPVAFRPSKKGRKRVLVVTGIDYPGHKWRQTAPVLAAGLDKDPRLAVEVVETPDFLRSEKLADYDTIVMHWMNWQTPDPGTKARENLKKVIASGKGMVLVHFACGAFQGWAEFAKLAGRAWNPKLRGHDPRGAFRVDIADADHPITRGMKPFRTVDELYTCLDGNAPIHVVATATSKVDKKDYPMAFVLTYGKGRVFHSVLGHDVEAFEPPGVLELYRRGTAWSAGLEPAAAPKPK